MSIIVTPGPENTPWRMVIANHEELYSRCRTHVGEVFMEMRVGGRHDLMIGFVDA